MSDKNKVKTMTALCMQPFVTARTEEIKSIVKILEDCDHGRRAFQTLPRHMQRRQVSSNPKRLPRYLREKHMRENKNGNKIVRRPSRKYRRRARNLLAEYNRRQKDHVWLETHLWHAKRFHMIRRWGYALPDSPTCKGYRATLKAAKSTCLVQDISYMCCIELEGELVSLLSGLSRITHPDDYAMLSHPNVQKGQQWEVVTFFKPDMYVACLNYCLRQPYGALGDVDIIWLASESSSHETSKIAKLWIWVHPSAHNHVVETLVGVYDLQKIENMENVSPLGPKRELGNGIGSGNNITGLSQAEGLMTPVVKTDSDSVGGEKTIEKDTLNTGKKRKNIEDSSQTRKKLKNVNKMKLANRNIPFGRTPKYYSNSSEISMTLLKDTLSRFCLTGPKVLNVLKAAIVPANIEMESVDGKLKSDEGVKSRHWWKDYFNDEVRSSSHLNHVDAWKKLSQSQLGKRMILPLTIRDPRTTLPRRKTPIKSMKDTMKAGDSLNWPIVCPLYESAIRDEVSLSKEPDHIINSRRAKLLTPGSDLPEIPEESKVPVLMLSRPQTHSIGYGKGMDIILCSGWGMGVWLPIVLNGGVAGGQQAAENLYMEFLSPQTPNSLPDTPAGNYHSALIAHERRKEFFKKPPTCRRNLIKLGIQYPFAEPWLKLAQHWVVGIESIYALRDPKVLKCLAGLFGDAFEMFRRDHGKHGRDEDDISIEDSLESLDLTLTEGSDTLQACNIVLSKPQNRTEALKEYLPEKVLQISELGCLVKVKIILENKGSLEPCAMVCLPREEDIKDKRNSIIEEPPHQDTQEDERKTFKRDHEKTKRKIHNMKTEAKLRIEKKMSAVGLSQSGKSYKKLIELALEEQKDNNKALYEKHASYNSCMEELWLMKRDLPLQCCSRKIMGYVTHGTFSMTIGRGAGIGWIALKPLLDCLLMYKKPCSTQGPVVCSVLLLVTTSKRRRKVSVLGTSFLQQDLARLKEYSLQ